MHLAGQYLLIQLAPKQISAGTQQSTMEEGKVPDLKQLNRIPIFLMRLSFII